MEYLKKYILCTIAIIIFKLSSISAINCPDVCQCSWSNGNLKVDCSSANITEIPDFTDLPIETLDLSNNLLVDIPKELSLIETLEFLDLSNNLIEGLDPNTFVGFDSLKYLFLQNNQITHWANIHPNKILLPVRNLHTLSLSGNPISSFSSNDESLILISKWLVVLDISYCKITSISGQYVIKGLTKLERLILNGNQLRSITPFASTSLQILDMSNCSLSVLYPNIFGNLESLIYINLSKNPKLSLFDRIGGNIKSDSLRGIDISFCNMDTLNLKGFPNLTTAILKGNMLRILDETTFESNPLIEKLDLSINALSHLDNLAFRNLKLLKHLDLSYNMIPRIQRDTFWKNDMLTSLNLSWNFITRFNKIVAKSLVSLNMSGCEITAIDWDALHGMPDINVLDLSRNLMSDLPERLKSETLQILDLNTCRITIIRPTTFQNLTALSKLNLAGNRLTTPFLVHFFDNNKYLREIYVGDNPWRCDCKDEKFRNFYTYLTEQPPRIHDRRNLRCASPEDLYRMTWESACYFIWHPKDKQMGMTEKMWTISMLSICILGGSVCLVTFVKKCLKRRKLSRIEREREGFLEEQRTVMRHNRMILEQEGQLNAPDPRETNPPCYEDAILMPRLERSCISMDELSTRRNKRKNRQSKAQIEEDGIERCDSEIIDPHRCRSEQVLSVYARESSPTYATIRRSAFRQRTNTESNQDAGEPSTSNVTQNLSAHQLANFQSCENSPYSKRKSKKEQLQSSENMPNTKSRDASPYARRELKRLLTFRDNDISHSASDGNIADDNNISSDISAAVSLKGDINVVENYFNESDSSGDLTSLDFQVLDADTDCSKGNTRNDDSCSNIIIIHHESKEGQV